MSNPEESPTVAAINALLDERAELQVRLSEITEDLQAAALRIASIDDRSERLRVVRHLYWRKPEVNVYALCAALLIDWDHAKDAPARGWDINLRDFMRFSKSLREMVGPYGYRDCVTSGCDGKIPINSRTQLYHPSGYRSEFLCERCIAAQDARRAKSWQDDAELRQRQRSDGIAKLAELKSKAKLSDEELVSLYRLMSWLEPEA